MSEYRTLLFFFFNDTATTEIYTLSLHDALPISTGNVQLSGPAPNGGALVSLSSSNTAVATVLANMTIPPEAASLRSEEHTSELQSQSNLVCRLLLEKKKTKRNQSYTKQM